MTYSRLLRRYCIICLIISCLSLASPDVFGASFGQLPKGTYVDAAEFPSLNAAVAASAGRTLLVGKATRLSGNLSIPADVSLVVVKGGSIVSASPSLLDIRGPFSAGLYQVFSGFRAGGVRFGDGAVKEVYPQWWGPDRSASIQSALESFNNVVLPKGVYMIDTQIRIPSNTTLRGEPGSILKRPDRTVYPDSDMIVNENFAIDPPFYRDADIVIDGITVDGNRSGRQSSHANGVYIRSAKNVRLKDVTVYNCGRGTAGMGTGILFSNVLNGLIDTCTSYSNDGDGIDLYTKNTNVVVRSCVAYDNKVIGIEVEGRLNSNYKSFRNTGISIDGCIAYDNGSYGHGILVDWSDAVTVTGNVVTDNKTWIGAILVIGCNDVTITGNSLFSNEGYPGSKDPAYGIAVWDHIYGDDGISRNVTISNNVLEENSNGIYLRNVKTSVIEGNSIKRLSNTSNGVYIDGWCENISVQNNTIRLSGTGSGVAVTSGTDGVMVSGNVVESAASGVIFPAGEGYTNVGITGNLLTSCRNGIYAFPGVSLAKGYITRNIFKSIAEKDISAGGPVILSSFFVQDNVHDKGIRNWNSVGSKPTTGSWQKGDRIINLSPALQGKAPDTYVVTGWLCIESGTPGKWMSVLSTASD